MYYEQTNKRDKQMNLSIQELIIETTRKCNMACEHCLRGDVENVNIKSLYIRRLFSQIDNIDTLTITGGEPSLKPYCN